jgi:Uma2 family endonuclease
MRDVTVLRREGDWTVDDLALLPDDGLQYELADGMLLVTPAPRPVHQRALGRLHIALQAACPPDLEVFFAPLDYQPTRIRSLQPDLLVVRRDDVGETAIERPLLLAIEILSPSTRSKDLILKRGLYEDSGVASYWVVDLDVPSITVWTLRDGRYGDGTVTIGDERMQATEPFDVSIVPSSLVG